MKPANKKIKTHILSLEEIASWWLPNQEEKLRAMRDQGIPIAELPALQRGFVWKPKQIELLWDSIIQGFPIGSLLLAEAPEKGGVAPTHHLLDGQQRTRVIALGFDDIWTGNCDDKWAALWVDLEKVESNNRNFAFQVVTKAHPWGYSREEPGKCLSAGEMHNALVFFRGDRPKTRACDLSINEVFPWKAEAPVPVSFLIGAILECIDKLNYACVADQLLKKLENANFKNFCKSDKFARVEEAITSNKNKDFCILVNKLGHALRHYEIPAPVLESCEADKEDRSTKIEEEKSYYSREFNLFNRINTKGTIPSKEEINYSLLKSVWPEAREVIENKLLKDRQFARPARMASLMMRLYLMSEEGKWQSDVSIFDFYKKIIDKQKLTELEDFCKDKGAEVVERAWDLLVGKEHNEGLPVVLAAQISQQAGDMVLLLMYWFLRLKEEPSGENLSDDLKKSTLGFVTAVAWFMNSKKQHQCVQILSTLLFDNSLEDKLETFFNADKFRLLYKPDNDKWLMMPLPSPDKIKKVFIDNGGDIKEYENNKDHDFWSCYCGNDTPETMTKYFRGKMEIDEAEAQKAWGSFVHKICFDRNFILYAQREAINIWFDWYDPTLPDQISDHNRPWDYDHILPDSWSHHAGGRTKAKVAIFVRYWVSANGNLRVWPLGLNRAKGNASIIEESLPDGYGEEIKGEGIEKVYTASFIGGESQQYWEKLNKTQKNEFLTDGDTPQEIFAKASILRTIDIYREWYEKLNIAELIDDSQDDK